MVIEEMRAFIFRHRRRKTEARLAVVVNRGETSVRIRGKCVEISRTGLFALVEEMPMEQEEVSLELHVPTTGSVVRLAAIAHPRSDKQCAFRFLQCSDEEQQTIDSELRFL